MSRILTHREIMGVPCRRIGIAKTRRKQQSQPQYGHHPGDVGRMVGEASGGVGDHPVAASCSSGCEAEIHDKLDRDRQVDLADIGLRFAKRAGASYADIRIWNKLIGVPWKIMFIGARDWVYRS
jgi:hypothetical protein